MVPSFRGLGLQSAGSVAYGPVARKMPRGRRAWQRKANHLMTARKHRETEGGSTERQEEARDKAHPSKNAKRRFGIDL